MTAPLFGTLTDDFSGGSINATLWTTTLTEGSAPYPTLTQSGGQLRIDLPASGASYRYLQSAAQYTLRNSAVGAQLGSIPANSLIDIGIYWGTAPSRCFRMVAENGTLYAQIVDGTTNTAASVTYDPVAHKFMRFAEFGDGVTKMQTSPDFTTWTTLAQGSFYSTVLDSAYFWLGGGVTSTAAFSGQYALFDNVNTAGTVAAVPIASVVLSPATSTQSGGVTTTVYTGTATLTNSSTRAITSADGTFTTTRGAFGTGANWNVLMDPAGTSSAQSLTVTLDIPANGTTGQAHVTATATRTIPALVPTVLPAGTAERITYTALHPDGSAAVGVTVTVTASDPAATVSPSSGTTASDGTFTTLVTPGPTSGPLSVTATAVIDSVTLNLGTAVLVPPGGDKRRQVNAGKA